MLASVMFGANSLFGTAMTRVRWCAVVIAVHALASAVHAQHPLELGRGGNAAPLSLDEHLTVEDSSGSPSLNVDSSMMLAADALEDRLAQSEHEIEKLRAQDEATDHRIEQLESRMETVSSVQTSAHAKINAIHEHVMAAKAAAQGANSAAQDTLKLAEVLSTAHKAFKRTLISVESSAAGAAASAVITHGGDGAASRKCAKQACFRGSHHSRTQCDEWRNGHLQRTCSRRSRCPGSRESCS